MNEYARPLEEIYFTWLYRFVASEKNTNPGRSYNKLLSQLHRTAFDWRIPNDDNRAEDGIALRIEFLNEENLEVDDDWLLIECSMLEMLVALCRRIAFESSEDFHAWFHKLLDNLGIRFSDREFGPSERSRIRSALEVVNNRTYSYSGVGGFFPLREPHTDQRKTELWYQMSAYLLENEEVGE